MTSQAIGYTAHATIPVGPSATNRFRTSAVLPLVGVVFLIVAWQTIAATQLLGRSVPAPLDVIDAFAAKGDILLRAALATGQRAFVGGALGYTAGVLLAAATAWFPRSSNAVLRGAVLVNAIPIVALGPVLMTLPARPVIPEVFAGFSVLFATVLTVDAGFRGVSRPSSDAFRVFGASRLARFVRLEVPSALPFAADAVRLAVPAAILGAILGEWFGSDRGLGIVMVSAMRNLQYGFLWSAALIAVVISVVFYLLGTLLERAASRRFGRPGEASAERPRLTRSANILIGVGTLAIVVAGWQLWVTWGSVPQIVAPAPLGVFEAIVTDAPELIGAAALTTGSALGGLVAGTAIGLVLAVAVSLMPWLASMLSPLSLIIPTVPIVVFIPVMGSVLGYGVATVFTSCVLMAFFPIYVLAYSGLRARPAGSDDLFSIYGASRLRRLTWLSIPAAVPSVLVALRIAAASSFLIAISAEWLMGQGGLGRVFSEKRVVLDTDGSWAAVLVAILLSVVAYAGAAEAERRLGGRWRS